MKQTYLLYLLCVYYILSSTNALQCKVCEENDKKCVFGGEGGDRECETDEDQCYSWFQRLGSEIHVRRDCISTSAANYAYIKSMIGKKNSGCVKRLDGMDCFTFCSTDLCN